MNIPKRRFHQVSLALFLFCLAVGITFDKCQRPQAHIAQYTEEVQEFLQKNEREAEAIFRKKNQLWTAIFHTDANSTVEYERSVKEMGELNRLPFKLFFLQHDSLVYWTSNGVHSEEERKIYTLKQADGPTLLRLMNGYYEALVSDFGDGRRRLVVLIPVRTTYQLKSYYLKNTFAANEKIPTQINISLVQTPHMVKSATGKVMFYLKADGEFKDVPKQKTVLIFFLLASLFGVFIINAAARMIVQRFRPWWGAAFLICVIILLRFLSFRFNFIQKFDNLPFFSHTFQTKVLNYSLGDLLLDILLLLWLMIFFHREFKVKEFINITRPWQILLTTLNYFSVVLGVLMVINVFKSLVLDSGVNFDFDNVFRMDMYSVLAIFGVIFLMFALFLFSHRMMLTIQKTGLPRKWRFYCLLASLMVAMPVIWFTELGLPFWRIVLSAFLFILLFDLYTDNRQPSLVWLGTWLVFFASFSAALLYKYNEDKDHQTKLAYAKNLAELKDTIAEHDFREFTEMLERDSIIPRLLFDSDVTQEDFVTLQRRIDQMFSNFTYIFNNYGYHFAVEKLDTTALTHWGYYTPLSAPGYYLQKLNVAKQTKYPDIFYYSSAGDFYSYLAAVYIFNPNDRKQGEFIFFEIKKRLREPSMVYTELVLTQNFKNLEYLDRFDYAIYRNAQLEEQNSKVYGERLDDLPLPLPPPTESISFTQGNRSELIYHSPNGVIVIIGEEIQNLLKPISLFSYLFLLLSFTVLLLAAINTVTKILPEVLQLSFWQAPSLRNRIQLAVVLTIILSFVMIGYVTVIYFRQTSNDYHENRLLRKMSSVLSGMEHEIQVHLEAKRHKIDLAQIVTDVYPIHRNDINIYDLQGNLITSSEMEIFNKGIVGHRMESVVFLIFNKLNQEEVIVQERIGDLNYKSAYVPLRLPNEEKLGYLELPYYAKSRNLRDDVTDFMGTLLNVYVFLLLIASLIAIIVANSITKPISVIGERFRRFKLGSNEPLHWEGKDELGALITDYNRMIQQVEESTDKLKKSEREGAWRVMAQQVAHEIKNPLTPMKLSIQYLQYALKSNPDNVIPLIDKVARTLAEQIDNLSQIATAFSDFAKMPKTENKPLDLKSLLESVHTLFLENEQVEINAQLPKSPLYVFADKNHLLRVFNNLISNAIQAIPDDRPGKIDLYLYREGDKAIVKVSDNGKGIADEMKDKVFIPHFTTRSSGMGLGLAMCKDIVEMAEGKIYFHTVVGTGTDFFVELPVIESDEVS